MHNQLHQPLRKYRSKVVLKMREGAVGANQEKNIIKIEDSDTQSETDYKDMYNGEREKNEKLMKRLKSCEHFLRVELKDNQRRDFIIRDLERALKEERRQVAKLERLLLAAVTAD